MQKYKMNKKIYFHIGLPKCASTTIQNTLSKSENIDYVGFIPEKKGLFWEDKEFAVLFDRVLRFSCDNVDYWKKKVHSYIEQSDKDIIVFSSESVTLRFLPWDLPTHIKLKFIKEVFPKETEFIYVVKDPLLMLKSIYKEWVLMGYRKEFSLFANELYEFKDISMFNDILLGHFLNNYQEIFLIDKLNLVYLDSSILSNISEIIGTELEKEEDKNVSIDDIDIEIIRGYNTKISDYDSFFDTVELHRAFFDMESKEDMYQLARKRLLRKDLPRSIKLYSNKSQNYLISDNIKQFINEDIISIENFKIDSKFIKKYKIKVKENY